MGLESEEPYLSVKDDECTGYIHSHLFFHCFAVSPDCQGYFPPKLGEIDLKDMPTFNPYSSDLKAISFC
jgi:hypothetical protein